MKFIIVIMLCKGVIDECCLFDVCFVGVFFGVGCCIVVVGLCVGFDWWSIGYVVIGLLCCWGYFGYVGFVGGVLDFCIGLV